MSTAQQQPLDLNKLNAFIAQFVTDLGTSVHAGMVVTGEKLGLYKALAVRPMSAVELANSTQTDERYVREWVASQAAGGYVTYDEKSGRFSFTQEQAFTLANDFDWGCAIGVDTGCAGLKADTEAEARVPAPPLVHSQDRAVKVSALDPEALVEDNATLSPADQGVLRMHIAFPCWW